MIDKHDADRVIMHKAVLANLAQLSRLLEVAPPLTDEQLAHRMAMSPKDMKAMLKRLRVVR